MLLGLVLPVYGKTQYRLNRKAERKDPTDLLGWEKVNGSCGVMAAACGLQCKPSFLSYCDFVRSLLDCELN